VLVVAQLLPPLKLHKIVGGQLPPLHSKSNMHHKLDQKPVEEPVLDLKEVAQRNIQAWSTLRFGSTLDPFVRRISVSL
jgi:hypothetical protein